MINQKLGLSVGERTFRVKLRRWRAWLQSLLERDKRKVFCLGLNKTGTSSLHRFFLDQGLRSSHEIDWALYSRIYQQRRSYYSYQCYSDGEYANFTFLHQNFPGSLFVLNTREERAWLRSRVKHALRLNHASSLNDVLTNPKSGWLTEQLFTDPYQAVMGWACTRRLYHKMVRNYFAGNDRFLELDVTGDALWQEKLGAFLAQAGFLRRPLKLAPRHENRIEENDLLLREQLQHSYAIVDRVLEQLGPESQD